jgi:AraC-like DNA-binding protein
MPRSPGTPDDSPGTTARLVAIPRVALLELREAGVDVDAIARELGLADPAARIPTAVAEALLDRALAQVGDPAFGLTAGARVRPELFGALGFAAMAAPTFGEALRRIARYQSMCSPDRFTVVPDGDATALQITMAPPEGRTTRMRVDAQLSFVLAFGRRLTQAPIQPRRVSLRGPTPSYKDRYAAVFGCPISFDRPIDEIVFAASDLALPLISRSPELADLFGDRADQLLAASGRDDAVEQVRGALRRLLRGDAPTLGVVARSLGQSERSLQRRLAEEGASFAELLDGVRREIALDRIAHSDIDLSELAFVLGFSTPGSLHRAFKRWVQMTPLSYRRAARSTPSS